MKRAESERFKPVDSGERILLEADPLLREAEAAAAGVLTAVGQLLELHVVLTYFTIGHGPIFSRRRRVNSTGSLRYKKELTDSPELLSIHNAFQHGQYQTVIDFDTASLSPENKIPARVLQLRAQVAIGEARKVLSSIKSEGNVPDLAAVKAFAQYSAGDTSESVSQVESLVETESENATVQLLGGTVLQAAGKTDEALSLLSKHQGSLEA